MLTGPRPSGQHAHPQTPVAQVSGTQAPSLQVCPHPQAGVQVFCGQRPFVQLPLAQPQVPPQPSEPPHVPSCGQCGAQHAPWKTTVPPGQGHVPPQLFGLPASEPSGGQTGWQQAPSTST